MRTLSLFSDTVHQVRHIRLHTHHLQNRVSQTAQSERLSPQPTVQRLETVFGTSSSQTQYNAPSQPYQRTYTEMYRYRGIDPGTLSGRQIVECRERDLEKISADLINTNLFDPARVGIRGATVHGHSLRLAEDGMMFDMLQRCVLEGGSVKYVKDQIGTPLDKKVDVGKPMDDAWLKANTTMFHSLVGTLTGRRREIKYIQRILPED